MGAQYITASKLVKLKPSAECCDCSKEADDSPEDEVWTIWNNKLIYCPKCASHEGIGLED